MTVPHSLPVAHAHRWQPLRIGLVDLFYYDHQEFWFRDGRLLLRGNNGTGKSKVLALTLPFLLDGDLSAHRVEPDGDPHKRMEWNLLLDGRREERLGYTWLELGRVTEDGERGYLTIGCGLKAVRGRGIADRWFFLSSQRIGEDLFLISPTGTVLGRERLEDAVGLHGQVLRTAEQYRRLVDEHLFHLGPHRYAALVDLLVQLRQPQLSKRPDEARLSRALSEALAPVDQAVLADIAAAFHDLQQQRDELGGLRETRTHVERFLLRYAQYARIAARRQGRELRSAQAAYEDVGRSLGGVREQITAATADRDEVAHRLEECAGQLIELTAAREELAQRPELKDLGQAERYAEAMSDAAAKARAQASRAARLVEQRVGMLAAAREAAGQTRQTVVGAAAAAADRAGEAGLASGHDTVVRPLGLPDGSGPDGSGDPSLAAAGRACAELARHRERAARQVLDLARAAERAAEAVAAARRLLGEREGDRDAARDAHAEAEAAVQAAIAELVHAWRAYAAGIRELVVPDPDEVGLADWAQTLTGPNPALAAARAAAQDAQVALAAALAEARAALAAAGQARRALADEQAELLSGVVRVPPAPHTRDAEARADRPGAPLWQVVDFAAELAAADRAGLEAALEASGLLDAWVTPDGRLLDPHTHDVVVAPGAARPHHLGALLRPAIDAADPRVRAVTPQTVAAVLASIAVGADATGEVWVAADGRFRLGPLHGAWGKPAAEYVGHGAREEARRRRLAELAVDLAAADRAVTAAETAVAAVAERQRTLAAETDRAPGDQELRDAHSVVAGTRHELARREEAVGRQRAALEAAELYAAAVARERDEAAADLGLPTAEPDLHDVLAAVSRYAAAVTELFAGVRQHADRLRAVATWTEELDAAQEAHEVASGEARDADDRHRDAAARLRELQQTIGATVADLQRRLTETRAAIGRLTGEQKTLTGRHAELVRRLGQVEGRAQELAERQAELAGRRDTAVTAFRRFAATGLLAVAVPDLAVPDVEADWAADPTVRLARRAEQTLAEVDAGDPAWRRVQDDVTVRFTELAEALTRHGHEAQAELKEDRYVVTIAFQGRKRAPGELTELLDAEVGYRERMLTAKERQLLEEHLVNDVASHLQELIAEAEAQVAQMNAELKERPTSTGMQLRLRWEPRPDGPDGLAEARARLLRQDADLWSPEDRAAVSEFLARQIERERAENEYGTWQEHLARALDYRAWHRFATERWQDGRWRPATGPASGGERVLAASLPLFAAASAHYRSAHRHAPRLVLLDEAFAGVDDDSRAKCLGLLASFDLDVMMTSEREWGFYATVPGIATHQLVRRDGIDAVHVSVWEWDGHEPRQVERDTASRAPAPRAQPAATSEPASGATPEELF